MVQILAGSGILHSVETWERGSALGPHSGRNIEMYLVPDTDQFRDERWEARNNEVTRICRALDQTLTPAEKLEAAPILDWLSLRDVRHQEMAHYRANEGEPVDAFEERIRIALEMQDLFPQHRYGACANIWLWLKLGAPDESLGGEARTDIG
jgi:hypothetical protein